MGGEHGRVNRELPTLPIGTRVRLTGGRTATLVALTFTSATVKIDPGQPPDRRANGRGEVEIAPAAEVDLVEDVRVDADPSTDDRPGLSTGRENAASTRAGASLSPMTSSPSRIRSTAKCDAPEDAPERASTSSSAITSRHPHAVRCAECGDPFEDERS